MTRILKLTLCVLFVAASLWGCADAPDVSTTTEATTSSSEITSRFETTTQIQTPPSDSYTTREEDDFFPEKGVFNRGPNWINYDSHGDGYAVYDNKGNEFFRTKPGEKVADFTEIGENLLRADSSGGTGVQITRFFDVEKGLHSPAYCNVLVQDYGRVVYIDFEPGVPIHDTLVVHDMFDPELNRNSFQRDFGSWHGLKLSMEVLDQLMYPSTVLAIEFTDKHHLYVKYYNNQGELVEETLKLK